MSEEIKLTADQNRIFNTLIKQDDVDADHIIEFYSLVNRGYLFKDNEDAFCLISEYILKDREENILDIREEYSKNLISREDRNEKVRQAVFQSSDLLKRMSKVCKVNKREEDFDINAENHLSYLQATMMFAGSEHIKDLKKEIKDKWESHWTNEKY